MKIRSFCKLFTISILALLFSEKIVAQEATVTVQQDARIPELLELKKELEKNNKLADGYTIQLYYGGYNRAQSVIRKYRGTFASWPASIEYETPNYKVWVGNFATRLEADRALLEIKQIFPDAFSFSKKRKKH